MELIGEIMFKTLQAQMVAVAAWAQIKGVRVETLRGVVRVYKVAS